MPFKNEKQLETCAESHIKELFNIYYWRVPYHNRVIDLVAVDDKDNLVAIEFKLKDWKRAIKQVITNANAFDYLYVCTPNGSFIEKLKYEANITGIGVMICDHDSHNFRIALQASKNISKWKPNEEYIRNYIKEGDNNGN